MGCSNAQKPSQPKKKGSRSGQSSAQNSDEICAPLEGTIPPGDDAVGLAAKADDGTPSTGQLDQKDPASEHPALEESEA